jgi:hypothetical protein
MLRLAKFFLLVGILSLLLAACGTSNESDKINESTNDSEQTADRPEQDVEDEDSVDQKEQVVEVEDSVDQKEQVVEVEDSVDQKEQVVEVEDSVDQKEQKEDNVEKELQEQTDSNVEDKTDLSSSEQMLSYSLNGESKEEKASLQKSDNQDFSLYVLPAYELTAEEPYNDSLFLRENDRIFMRISVLPSDSDLESLKENTTAQLQAVSENVQTLTPPNDEFLQGATIMEATNNGEVLTAYLIKKQESIIKLLLFTNEQEDHRDAFIQMAKTIKAGN